MFDGRWRHAVDRSTQPVGKVLVRTHVTADVLTIFGLVMSVVTAVVVGSGHLLIGVGLLFAVGLPDLFDGPVAKASGTSSVRGAFLDSVADRISDGFMLGGVAWFLVAHHDGQAVLVPFGILGVTALISYQRAKAELLGISAKGGLMERAERFILLGLCFIAGSISLSAFVPSLWVFLGLVVATAIGRFVRVIATAEGPVRPVRPDAHSGHLAEVSRRAVARWREETTDSRWRAWRTARAQRDAAVPRTTVPRISWTRRSGELPSRRSVRRTESGRPATSRSGRYRVGRPAAGDGGRDQPSVG
jgi:CDP-diacylglycerol--glycerol-3-phosphate 3-phosphatidyltransferase